MGRKKRTFTGDFKLKVASEALAGEKTIQAIAAENDISVSLVGAWKKILQQEGPRFFNEKSKIRKELEQHLEELEREKQLLLEEYGKSQLENVLLKKTENPGPRDEQIITPELSIELHGRTFSTGVSEQCRLLGVARSNYYWWLRHKDQIKSCDD